MASKRLFLVSPAASLPSIKVIARTSLSRCREDWRIVGATTLQALITVREMPEAGDVLVSFGIGEIVPPDLLRSFDGLAFNLHAASSDYPGRDPHHFAVYEGASEYGAVLHRMTDKVDAGAIVAEKRFPVDARWSPDVLLQQANVTAMALLENVLPNLLDGDIQTTDLCWRETKGTRRQFLSLCEIGQEFKDEDYRRRFRAFDGGQYDNLYTQVAGQVFSIDKERTYERFAQADRHRFSALIDDVARSKTVIVYAVRYHRVALSVVQALKARGTDVRLDIVLPDSMSRLPEVTSELKALSPVHRKPITVRTMDQGPGLQPVQNAMVAVISDVAETEVINERRAFTMPPRFTQTYALPIFEQEDGMVVRDIDWVRHCILDNWTES